MLRNFFVATWFKVLWQRLQSSSDGELAAIAAKAIKEARYHQQHAGDWVVRLGDGTEESAARMRAAVARAWPYVPELFEADAVDESAAQTGLGPRCSELRDTWFADVKAVFDDALLELPADVPFRSTGRSGVHSEHLGFMLAEMQHLQRAYPGGAW